MPSGLSGVNAFFTTVKTIYATSDITTAISVGLDAQVLGYKLGAGAGTTLGQAAQKLYSCSGASGDVVQTTAASQPLLLVHSGANYWFGSGVSGNSSTTPNATANQITGDIDLICKANISTSTGANTFAMISKFAIGTETYGLWATNNRLRFYGRTGATIIDQSSTSTINSFYGTDKWYRITRVAATGFISFYIGDDGINWTLLNSVSSVSGNLQNFNLNLFIGIDQSSFFTNVGKIYRATISNTIGGAPVVDFNPNQYNAATSQTQWTSTTGEVWTINVGTATTGYKGVLVDRTIVQGDGVDDSLVTSSTINLSSAFTIYAAFKGYNNEGGSGKITFGKQNIDGAVFRNNITNIGAWIGASGLAVLNQAATVLNLNLATFKRKVSSNTLQVNNGAIATNTGTNPIVQSNISVFSATSFGVTNSLITSGIFSNLEDDTTQKTAMYNYIRSINGNSF